MMKPLIVLAFSMLLGGCSPGSTAPAAETAQTDNEELKQLYEADQNDRKPGDGEIDWAAISRRDSLRRERVLALLAADEVHTSEDYRHSAMIFQHGNDTTAALRAFDLAKTAVDLDTTNTSARWLMAAAWDRYLMRKEEPQWYGTQFVKPTPDAPWQLYEVDTTQVTDEERAWYGVRTLAEARAKAAELNAQD